MQNKGAIVFLAITLTLVSIYQLSFTGATYMVKRDARDYAKGDLHKELNYLDSIASLPKSEWNYLGFTFKECQSKEINLGLDLKGGMNVILEVSVEDIVRAMSNYSTDKNFNEALRIAKEMQKESQDDFLDLFKTAYTELDPNARLAAIFSTIELKQQINFNSSNDEVIKVLKTESDGAIDNAFNILRSRIDKFGVTQPNISLLEGRGRISIELPGVKDPKRVRSLLQGTASLEFWETYNNGEILPYLSQANDVLKEVTRVVKADVAELAAGDQGETTTDTTKVTGEETLLDLVGKEGADTTVANTLEEFNIFFRKQVSEYF